MTQENEQCHEQNGAACTSTHFPQVALELARARSWLHKIIQSLETDEKAFLK